MWQQLSLVTEAAAAEALADALTDRGALSVSLEDAEDQPLFEPKPGETPVWRRTRVIGLFDRAADLRTLHGELAAAFGERLTTWGIEEIEDQPWERAWLEHFRPLRCGRRLWICPTGFAAPEPGAVEVRLDPGLAFGTGTHPTTALCLDWLDAQDLHGQTVVDYGCGSGILAIAAVLLGAECAHAVDIDPQALTATEENARKNGVESRIHCTYPGELGHIAADVLLANILAGPLIEQAEDFSRRVRPYGHLVLSGILTEQASAVRDAYHPWFFFNTDAEREGWTRLEGTRRT